MAATTTVLKDASVSIDDDGGSLTDISTQVESISLTYGTNTDTVNAMGDNTEINAATLKTWSASITVFMQEGSGNLGDIIFNGLGNVVSFEAKRDSGSVSASNPKYSGEAIVTSWNPIDNAHGEVQRATIELVAAGDLSRAIA